MSMQYRVTVSEMDSLAREMIFKAISNVQTENKLVVNDVPPIKCVLVELTESVETLLQSDV